MAKPKLSALFGNFTDRKQHVVTQRCLDAKWGVPLRCCLCGHRARVGSVLRWIYTNDEQGPPGNPFVCKNCDGPEEEVRARLSERSKEFKSKKFWWFRRMANREARSEQC